MCIFILCFQLPPLQDDGPVSDNYGRFSARDRSSRRGGSFGGRGGGGGRGPLRVFAITNEHKTNLHQINIMHKKEVSN